MRKFDQMYRDQMYRDEPRIARRRRGRRFRVYVCVASILGAIIGVGLRAGVAEAAPSVWSVTPSPNSGGATNLNAVSCTSRTFCMAVGSLGETGTLVETWNGNAWTVSPSPSPGGDPDELFGVSCRELVVLAAVGWHYDQSSTKYVTLIEIWDGAHWSIASSPSPSVQSVLFGVSCVSSSSCKAVGYDDGGPGFNTLVLSWNGTSWSIEPSRNRGGQDSVFQAVSCTAADNCTAVGWYDGVYGELTLAESWNGTTWSVTPSPNPGTKGNNELNGVTCRTHTSCEAVGDYSVGSGPARTLVESWNGRTWTYVSSPNATPRSNVLASVSCTTSSSCVAVGFYVFGSEYYKTLIESWNGFDWSVTPSPNPSAASQLLGVICTDRTSCEAVGYHGNGSFESEKPLVETGSPPTISGVKFEGSPHDPTVVVTGSGFGSVPVSLPAGCNATGKDYPHNVLYFHDDPGAWSAGKTGNCIGLKIIKYTNTMIKFDFGSWYDSTPAFYKLKSGDTFEFVVNGSTATGTVDYS